MRTSEPDENYDISGIDHAEYVEEFGELRDCNFTLDREIDRERAKRVELYSRRVDEGLDIFNGEPLSLTDLLCMRGLGNFTPSVAITKLSQKELSRYKESQPYEIQRSEAG